MKRNFTFLGKIAIAILLVCGMTVSGCKKEPLPGDGSEVVKPGDGDEDGDGKEDGDGNGDGDNPSEQQSTVTVTASGVALTSVVFIGTVSADIIAAGYYDYGVSYSTSNRPNETEDETILKTIVRRSIVDEVAGDGSFEIPVGELKANTKYYYCSYILKGGQYSFGEIASFETADLYSAQADIDLSKATDLSADGVANCYIVTETAYAANSNHSFKLPAVKGNDKAQALQDAAKAEILWESTGSNSIPERCTIVAGVCAKDGYVAFRLPDTYKEGNAVIAAKDAEGTILWSWHIWLTDQPGEDVYPNNAGTMMDRNLGATSVQGDNNCGLLYQWGRKDPFLGYSSGNSAILAESSIKWPEPIWSDENRGTIEWSIKNPITFILATSQYGENMPEYTFVDNGETYVRNIWKIGNNDWVFNPEMKEYTRYYLNESEKMIKTDRWGQKKTIYDPCPSGWIVPAGGEYDGVWAKAGMDPKTKGENGVLKFTLGSVTVWYPCTGIHFNNGTIGKGSKSGYYWSSTVNDLNTSVYKLSFNFDWNQGDTVGSAGAFNYSIPLAPATGCAVRCCKIQ